MPVVIELSEHERISPGCGGIRARFADEVSEQLDYVPASLFVRQFVRRKYACRSCQEHVAIPATRTAARREGGVRQLTASSRTT